MTRTKLPIATRNGRPAYENPPPRKRGDMAEWRAEMERRRQDKPVRVGR